MTENKNSTTGVHPHPPSHQRALGSCRSGDTCAHARRLAVDAQTCGQNGTATGSSRATSERDDGERKATEKKDRMRSSLYQSVGGATLEARVHTACNKHSGSCLFVCACVFLCVYVCVLTINHPHTEATATWFCHPYDAGTEQIGPGGLSVYLRWCSVVWN